VVSISERPLRAWSYFEGPWRAQSSAEGYEGPQIDSRRQPSETRKLCGLFRGINPFHST